MTVGELRKALKKWDSDLDVRIQVGDEFQEFSDMDIYMNDFGRIAIDSGCSDLEEELDELREEVEDLEYDVAEKDDVIDNAYNEAANLMRFLAESPELDIDKVKRLAKIIMDTLA